MVEIPDAVAKRMALWMRSATEHTLGATGLREWADLLDPKPPTLREQVAKAWCADYYGEYSDSAKNPAPDQLDAADAVLAVVADWLEAQPLTTVGAQYAERRKFQRDHDVRLVRGGSDV